MKKQVLLFFALLCPVFAFCQGIRYDTPPILNSSGKPISGAVISLCPGTATISGSTCSPASAQGFTSITLGTACSVGSPVVLTGLNTCQATSDTLGNAGFWLSPGAYIYCINAPSQIGQCYNLTVPVGVNASSATATTAALTMLQPTPATSGANQSSFNFCEQSSYWTGSAAATDQWCWVNTLGSGSNPTSTYTLTHSGSSGGSTISLANSVNMGTNSLTAGPGTFSGAVTVNSLEKTIFADQQTGADACAKINASFALLPTTGTGAGGIVDATAFQGDQTCSAGITFAPANSSVMLKLGNSRLIVSSGTALTCPATIACKIQGTPTNTGTTGDGSVIIHNGAANDGVDWFGSYGRIDDLEIASANTSCGSTCSSLLIKGISGVGASHNVFNNLRLSGPGSGIANSAGLTLSADTASALACCNTFEGLSVSQYADGVRMVTTNSQGPTDNWFYGSYIFNNVNGVNIQSGDVNGILGAIISSNTTGINVTSGRVGNQFWARLESNTTNCNSSGTGGFFLLTQDASTCTVAAGANGDSLLGTGNSGVLPLQRLQSGLILPFNQALDYDGDFGISRLAVGIGGAGNTTPGDKSGFFKTAGTVQLTSDLTLAANTNLQTVLSWTFPATAFNWSFHCNLAYSQATAAVADAFGIQAATNAPTRIDASGSVLTAAAVITSADLTNLTTTTATNIVTFTPSATATVFHGTLDGTFQLPASANTVNIMASQSNASDLLTVKAGSYCQVW